ncbi:MAG: RNA methyltransferase [Planctomycetes bacterium]|nr:RNA methyltransferase [Planctomycetota bacterium]
MTVPIDRPLSKDFVAQPNLIALNDPADPRVREYRALKEGDLSRGIDASAPFGSFICEGALVAEHLLASSFPCRSFLIAESKLESQRALLEQAPAQTPVYVAPDAVLHEVVGFKFHRGLLAAGARTAPPSPAEARNRIAAAPALVVLEDLTNLDNMGGLFRCVSALAPEGTLVVLSPQSVDPLYRKAIRVSMGHSLRIPFVTLAPWEDAPQRIRSEGFELLALTPDAAAETMNDVSAQAAAPQRKLALALGSEGPGLSRLLLAQADRRVRIAQRPGVDSLNVMVAGAIAMSALFRPGG